MRESLFLKSRGMSVGVSEISWQNLIDIKEEVLGFYPAHTHWWGEYLVAISPKKNVIKLWRSTSQCFILTTERGIDLWLRNKYLQLAATLLKIGKRTTISTPMHNPICSTYQWSFTDPYLFPLHPIFFVTFGKS